MLLVADLPRALDDLAHHAIDCPTPHCDGTLAPWGHARLRRVRLAIDRIVSLRPRRARCRRCGRTHVLSDATTYPRRLDTVETTTRALLAAAAGAGHRQIAAQLDRPETTVRDWLRRARANSEAVRADATVAFIRIDANSDHRELPPGGSALADMLTAVGAATRAATRLAPTTPPWVLTVLVTRAGILATHPSPRWLNS